MMMNPEVWKFPLSIPSNHVDMPSDAVLLGVQVQHGSLWVWAVVTPSDALVSRHIEVYGTGHPMPPNHGAYVATVQTGPLVWHVFDQGLS